jgi:uncharacterized membrane protein
MTTNLTCRESGQAAPDKFLIAATSAALLTLIPVAAHQLGYLRHLPDPPANIFASDEITESSMAHPLGIPDSVLGLGSYGLTLALVLLAQSRPKAQRLLALKLIGDGAIAGFNVVRQVAEFGKLCSWCTGTALCTAAMVVGGRRLIAEQIAGTDSSSHISQMATEAQVKER